jgi:DNA invertase Pin-like site-specific DNA recombinase
MNLIAYTRVSTSEQADSGAGLEAQRTAISNAERNSAWTLAGAYEDAGASGKSLAGRQGLHDALEAIERGDADGLVVAKLDRLSRSLLDFSTLMERSGRNGWAIVCLDLGVDTSTPAGEMMANVLATFAQFERRLIGQRTRDALAVKKAEGVILGRPVSVDAETAGQISVMRAAGLSFAKIAAALNEDGVPASRDGRQWWPSTVRQVALRA